jgi:hypothetical protein
MRTVPTSENRSWLGRPDSLPRLSVVLCVVALVVALVVRYPAAIRDAGRSAGDNSALSYLDRDIAGGNSVVVDQLAMVEARGSIPKDGTYEVIVGEPTPAWSELTATFAGAFALSYLLPRRQEAGAPWVLCYGCDRSQLPGAQVVWEDVEQGVALLKRAS